MIHWRLASFTYHCSQYVYKHAGELERMEEKIRLCRSFRNTQLQASWVCVRGFHKSPLLNSLQCSAMIQWALRKEPPNCFFSPFCKAIHKPSNKTKAFLMENSTVAREHPFRCATVTRFCVCCKVILSAVLWRHGEHLVLIPTLMTFPAREFLFKSPSTFSSLGEIPGPLTPLESRVPDF